MALETELKFIVDSLQALQQKLHEAGALFTAGYFEENLVLDTPGRDLKGRDMLLRLRRAEKSVLCLKYRPDQSEPEGDTRDFKVYWELQTAVQDAEQMELILKSLGYQPAFRYEKVREKWNLGQCTVCLDLLPFGSFVEIEAEQAEILHCALQLGLDPNSGITKTYYELHQDHRREQGLWPEESFVFPEPRKSELIEQKTILC